MIKKSIQKVSPGMVLGKTIYGVNYEVLLNRGIELSQVYIDKLKERGYHYVFIEDEDTADIVIEDPLSDRIRLMATKDILKVYQVTNASLSNIEIDTNEAIVKCIQTKVKKNFQESTAFQQLLENINDFIEEIMTQDVLSGLNSIKTVDNYTFEHSIDSAVISLIIAKKLLFEKKKLSQIAIGEFLHDIGKIFIDEKILNKQGKLTDEEFNRVKEHPTFGYELLKDIENVGYLVSHVPYQHHERQDGKGYPRGLSGSNKIESGEIVYESSDKLILFAEIAALADVYDACITDRPYRRGFPPDAVYELIRQGAGTQFNKELVDCFLSVVPKYPVGTEVRITHGQYKDFSGYVKTLNTEQLSRPKIKLLYDVHGNKIKPIELDLSINNAITIECISN